MSEIRYPRMASFFFKANDEADEDKKAQTMRRALRLTNREIAHICELLEHNFDCNENPDSLSALLKLKAEETALASG